MPLFVYSEKIDNWEPTIALGPIKKVREEIVNFNQQLFKIKDRVYTFVETGISHTNCKYLNLNLLISIIFNVLHDYSILLLMFNYSLL